MLQLIISILLSLGLNSRSSDGEIIISRESMEQLKSSSAYSIAGGDEALNSIAIPDDVDPLQ